ncbi:MAG: GntR family transcriptional regulator, partial [Planctomycetota bacterium]|nr:GntR family transcriptional regulator [Planctomycetota bacterium]
MTIRVDPSRATPPSRQIVEAILDEIARGHFSAGARLPSVRGLAAEALVNPNTVGKAYRELELLGVSEGR